MGSWKKCAWSATGGSARWPSLGVPRAGGRVGERVSVALLLGTSDIETGCSALLSFPFSLSSFFSCGLLRL